MAIYAPPSIPSLAAATTPTPPSGSVTNGAAATNVASQMIVDMASTTSPAGMITTVITYANGSTATVTSSGPMPGSRVNLIV
jgi:hypothetical protein